MPHAQLCNRVSAVAGSAFLKRFPNWRFVVLFLGRDVQQRSDFHVFRIEIGARDDRVKLWATELNQRETRHLRYYVSL